MKKIFFALLLFLASPAMAQWQTPNHSVPIGLGSGTGFGSAAPGPAGSALISNGATADPSFQSLGMQPSVGVRQSILSASVDGSGTQNFAAAGTGLNVNLNAGTTSLYAAFAAGFGGNGAVDFIGVLNLNTPSFWASLPASQYSFLSIDRDPVLGTISATQTLMPPQRGPAYYQPTQALLHLTASLVDDGGNAWASNGATFVAPIAGFGSGAVSLNGSGSYVQTTNIRNPGLRGFTAEEWVKLPTTNVSQSLWSVGNAFGAYVATDSSGHLQLWLSSGGNNGGAGGSGAATCAATTCWDIANGVSGSTVVTTGVPHHVRLTYDLANYRLFLDGVLQITVASTSIVWPDGVAMAIGAQVGISSSTAAIFQEFSFVPYARSVSNFTPPTAAYTISGDWFDTNQMVMKTITGPGPTFTPVQRLYVGEAITGPASVSAVYNYSATARVQSTDFSLDQSFGKLRVGNSTIYAEGTPQFISSSTPGTPCVTVLACTINTPVTWLLSGPASILSPAQQVPPDAKWFKVQLNVVLAALHSTGSFASQDCTFTSRIPIGTIQNYATLGAAYGQYQGMGNPVETSAFTEYDGIVVTFPVINGVAAFETDIGGGTCLNGGTNNQARIVSGILIGYSQ